VDRNLYYRHFGPFIEHLLKKKHNVHLLHDYSHSRTGMKSGYFPALFSVPQFENNIPFFGLYFSNRAIIEFVRSNKIEFIFSLNSYYHYQLDIREIKPCKWVVLQHWADNYVYGFKDVCGCDYFLSYSEFWWDSFLSSKYCSDKAENLLVPKIHHIGHPLNFLIDELDKSTVKKKYNLDPEKGVLTYLPIGTPNAYDFENLMQRLWLVFYYSSLPPKTLLKMALSVISKMIFRFSQTRVKEKSIILAIRKFCDKNNMTFVVKSRLKTPLSEFFTQNADIILYDETFYPPTISEMLFVSDITISHFSMATFEAIAMKSFTINLNLEPVFQPFTGLLTDCFNSEWIDDFNMEGLGSIINADDFIKNFSDAPLNGYKFDEKKYGSFMKKYFSTTDSEVFEQTIDNIIAGNIKKDY